MVVKAASFTEQAAAFVQSNADRVAVNPFAMHKAAVAAGVPAAKAVDRLCRKAGIEIPAYPIPSDKLRPGQTLALATITQLPRKYGDEIATAALVCVASAYREKSGALRAPVFRAVATLIEGADDPVAYAAKLREHLERTDPKKLELSGLSYRSGSGGTEAAALVYLLKKTVGSGRRLPVAAGDFVRAPTRAQLMGGR